MKKFPRKIALTGEINNFGIDFAAAHDNNFPFFVFVYACNKNETKGNSERVKHAMKKVHKSIMKL